VITRAPLLTSLDALDHRTAHTGLVARQDVARQHVGVLALIAAGCADGALGAVVVVPAGDRGDGDDRIEPFDAGRRNGVRQGSVVGDADHADPAGRPAGDDAIPCTVVGPALAGQPSDHGDHGSGLLRPPGGRAARRRARADGLGVDVRVAARSQQVLVRRGVALLPRPGNVQRHVDVVVLHPVAAGRYGDASRITGTAPFPRGTWYCTCTRSSRPLESESSPALGPRRSSPSRRRDGRWWSRPRRPS
jgi:hypothetical protein